MEEILLKWVDLIDFMKTVCICGSFKFHKEMLDLEDKLRKESIECFGPRKEKSILKCFDKIDKADVVYVVDPNGYVGNSVSADIGYAYAKISQFTLRIQQTI